jgi:hypothetical protein
MDPLEGGKTSLIKLKIVVFPDPFGPIIPKISFSSMEKLTF